MRSPRDIRASNGYDRWESRSERPMLALSLVFVVVLVVPLGTDLPPWGDLLLRVTNVVLWGAFAVDYLARLYLTPARWRFVRRHPLDLLVVLVPFLRPLRVARLLRLARLGAVTGVLHGRARRSLHATVAAYVATSATALLVLAAAAMYDPERTAKGANIRTFGDSLWWAATTITTVGYGDRYPTTGRGRLVAVGLMVVGIALLGVVTATIAAWFVGRLHDVEETEQLTEATLAEVLRELREIRARLDEQDSPRAELDPV